MSKPHLKKIARAMESFPGRQKAREEERRQFRQKQEEKKAAGGGR